MTDRVPERDAPSERREPQPTPLKVERVAVHNHDFVHICDLEDPGTPLEFGLEKSIAAFLVEFNKPVDPDTIIAGTQTGEDPDTFSFLVSKPGAAYVPGFIRFDHALIPWEEGKGVLFINNEGDDTFHYPFKPGAYTVTLFGDEDLSGNRPAIAGTDGIRLDGEPLGLPSGDGQEGGNFVFEFVIHS